MMKHTLTAKQARHLGMKKLAGKEVDVVLYRPEELDVPWNNSRITKEIYFQGRLIDGTLDLDNQ